MLNNDVCKIHRRQKSEAWCGFATGDKHQHELSKGEITTPRWQMVPDFMNSLRANVVDSLQSEPFK